MPDFPKPGILFKDITPVFEDPVLCGKVIETFYEKVKGMQIDAVLGIESRGFLFGFMLAQRLSKPFVMVRKAGKLPPQTVSREYALEYGTSRIEMREGSVKKNWNVLIHDDLLATGGTAAAAAELVKMQGGTVSAFAFLIELEFLKGREKLQPYTDQLISLVTY